jgi:starch synthase
MRVAFIAAECEPWAKTGGLGDVVDALARSLGRVKGGPDFPIDVFLPRYRAMRLPPGPHASRTVRVPDPLALNGATQGAPRGTSSDATYGATEVTIVDVAGHGYRLRLVDHPPAFDRAGYYGDPGADDYPDNAWRFGLLCRAALETLRTDGDPVDLIHVHDWHAAPAVLFRDRFYPDDPVLGRAATLLTIHNLAYQGWTPRDRLGQLGLAPGDGIVAQDAVGIDLLAAAIERAEMVNTVSPGYAAEALTPGYGMGLDGILGQKVRQAAVDGTPRFIGILNGLDTALWDPSTDGDLAVRYGVADRAGKAGCRADLLRRHGLDPHDPGPVLGMIGRLDPQKGFDILADAAPSLVGLGARIIVQGSGDPRLAEPFGRLAAARPASVVLIDRFDRSNARRIYAGADLFVMPSRFEPCGQGQMISMRYGTPPIVRQTGGLGDTVIDETARPDEGTGFVFGDSTPEALIAACERAFRLRGRDGSAPAWRAVIERGMALDFGWDAGSAPQYVSAYGRAVALRRAGAPALRRGSAPGTPDR